MLNNKKDVVALGHVYSSAEGELIHGVPLGPDLLRVEINMLEMPQALLPCPSGEFLTVKDALDSFVAWPKGLVLCITDVSLICYLIFVCPLTTCRKLFTFLALNIYSY